MQEKFGQALEAIAKNEQLRQELDQILQEAQAGTLNESCTVQRICAVTQRTNYPLSAQDIALAMQMEEEKEISPEDLSQVAGGDFIDELMDGIDIVWHLIHKIPGFPEEEIGS